MRIEKVSQDSTDLIDLPHATITVLGAHEESMSNPPIDDEWNRYVLRLEQ